MSHQATLFRYLVPFWCLAGAAMGTPLIQVNFEGSFARRDAVSIEKEWKRFVAFGAWERQADGSLVAKNIPEENHGPSLIYQASTRDLIVECEFKLPNEDVSERHLRIYFESPNHRGHNLSAIANISTRSLPIGISIQHLRKGDDKTVLEKTEFARAASPPTSGHWNRLRLEIKGKTAKFTINDITIQGSGTVLDTNRHKLAFNFGKAGGSLRSLRISLPQE